MLKETIKISLTDFINFVNKAGTAKQTMVRQIKYREDYEPFKDFYKPIREGIVHMHKNKLPKESLDRLSKNLRQESKKNQFPVVIDGYKSFLGRKNYVWFDPPQKDWTEGGVTVSINPELGLEKIMKDGTSEFYVIKLYFKDEKIQKSHIDQILTLMELQLRDLVVEPEVRFAFLNVRKSKLYVKKDRKLEEVPLFKGEIRCFSSMWNEL